MELVASSTYAFAAAFANGEDWCRIRANRAECCRFSPRQKNAVEVVVAEPSLSAVLIGGSLRSPSEVKFLLVPLAPELAQCRCHDIGKRFSFSENTNAHYVPPQDPTRLESIQRRF